jgi:hypothetical protein
MWTLDRDWIYTLEDSPVELGSSDPRVDCSELSGCNHACAEDRYDEHSFHFDPTYISS